MRYSDDIDGSEELKDSMEAINTAFRPMKNAEDRVVKKAKTQIKKAVVKKISKSVAKGAASAAATTAGGVAGTAAGPGGTLVGLAIGAAVGEVEGYRIDKKAVKKANRARLFRLFKSKMGNEEDWQTDSFLRAGGSILLRKVLFKMKYLLKILLVCIVISLPALLSTFGPVIIAVAALYNSPFAIFLPKTSNEVTAEEYVEELFVEFETKVENEMTKPGKYDRVYRYGAWDVRTYKNDILAVYMVKYGYGEMAADMTWIAKNRLKSVFDDMVMLETGGYSYEEEKVRIVKDEDGNFVWNEDGTLKKELYKEKVMVKTVTVKLKEAGEMQEKYKFSAGKKADLRELMGMME